ncbi:MAG: hypothetical protein ACLFM7_04615 [Bacteroidales bacterium]
MKSNLLKISAILLLALTIGFTACEEDEKPEVENPKLVSVDVESDNSKAVVYFSEGLYKNDDATGALDANSFDVTLDAEDLEISDFTVDHEAGDNSADISLTLSSQEATGEETIQVEIAQGAAYDEDGNPIQSGSATDKLAKMEGETDIYEKLLIAYAESGTLPGDYKSVLKSYLTDNNNDTANLGYNGDPVASLPELGANTDAASNPGGFFEDVSYKGAFDPNGDNWASGWTLTYGMDDVYDYNAEDTVTISDNITSDETWNKETLYKLDGFVFVEDGATLTIEAGTMVQGKPGQGENASALIVKRGGKLHAEGTADKPIVFTGQDDTYYGDGYNKEIRGLWGGLIVLGKATTNNSTDKRIEGIPEQYDAFYGGDDDSDNSGVFKYVSIRHGGTDIGQGNEINGFTLGAVGNGTEIRYIEVIANVDDGVEWFGGAADTKNLLISYCGDDSYDYDEGFHGKGQFWATIQSDDAGDRLGEHDGGSGDTEAAEPYAKPEIYNATYIGHDDNLITFRDNAGGTYANSIFVNTGEGIEVEYRDDKESSSYDMLNNDHLVIKDNIFHKVDGSN